MPIEQLLAVKGSKRLVCNLRQATARKISGGSSGPKGFEILVPLYRSIRRWKDRNQSVLSPLFAVANAAK